MLRFYRFFNSIPLFLLSVFTLVLLLILMLRPSDNLPDVHLFPMADKVVHFFAFGFVSTACFLDIGRYFMRLKWQALGLCGIGLIGLGIAIEYMQDAMGQGRSGDIWDAVADAVGVVVFPVVLFPLIHKCISLYRLDVRCWSSNKRILSFVKGLYINSFPDNERRLWSDLVERISDNHNRMKLLVIYSRNNPIGFITWWQLDCGYRYVEHFAIDPRLRGFGFGYSVIMTFLANDGAPVVLEVEPEDVSETARRRIGFYIRCGFFAHKGYEYIQPSYAEGLEPVRLMLMTTESNPDLNKITQQIHSIVYGNDN